MRLRRILLFGFFVLLSLGAGLSAGLYWPTPDSTPIENATRPMAVITGVDLVPDREQVQFAARIEKPELFEVHPSTDLMSTGSSRMVVTRAAVAAGDTISSGTFAGEVSGRPIFALSQNVPLHRDLMFGSTGQDVTTLQEELAHLGYYDGEHTGRMASETIRALDLWYRTAGYTLPVFASGQRGLRLAEVIMIPSGTHRVVASAAVGNSLDSETPLLVLAVGEAEITGRLNILQAQRLGVGASVEVFAVGASPAITQIISIGEFSEDSSGLAGHEVRLRVPESWNLEEVGEQVTAREVSQPELVPAVPLIAVREDHEGTFLLLECEPGAVAPRRVNVSILRQVGGHAILAPNQDLPAEPRILVGVASCQ